MKNWKNWLPDVVAVVLFAVIAFAYFYPADVENRILFRHDASAGIGAGQEAGEYQKATGERTRWSNSIFGGMPTYQTAPAYDSTDALAKIATAYHLWLPENVWYVFAYLLGFYILLRAFNFRQWLAMLGAIVWAFSSYFFIIIAAGHIWKVMALAYLPPLIAGVVLAYRGKYLWGLAVTAIFAAFEVNANHVQMTYYYLFIIAAMIIAFIIEGRKDWRHVLKATGVCAAGALIGVLLNLSNLYHTWQYSQESMRSQSELVKADAANQTSSGLDRDYITQWSYGIDETWTLLVPNTKGGASMPISMDEKAMEHADSQVTDFFGQVFQMNPYSNFSEYWGTQPGTSGPVYVGAFVLFLFVLGLFIVKGPLKWALLAVTILSVLLSWGKNFMPMTDLFLDYFPMYAKFRTVASILVIAEFTIPLLAMLALKQWVDTTHPQPLPVKEGRGNTQGQKQTKEQSSPLPRRERLGVGLAFALTGGLCLLFALMPGVFFDFNSAQDAQTVDMMNSQISQVLADHPDVMQQYQAVIGRLLPSLAEMHKAVFVADCWRSLLIILIGVALMLLYRWGKLRASWMIAALTVLCLVDMWQVNKRYLNDEMFVDKTERENPIKPTNADEQILQDKSLDYRVLNLTTNTFNENETSYFHKSIGGYHAAKLRRYQELIDAHIVPEIEALMNALPKAGYDMSQVPTDSVMPVLNMLNTKYLIMSASNQPVPLQNYQAYGNAWLVDKVNYVNNANEELDALGTMPLRHEAVADKKFADVLGQSVQQDTLSRVTLDKYQPNQLTYTVQTGKGGVVVFSEIYYPGWTATIDGEEAELGRVNYVLRSLNVKPGKHEVVLSFFPRSIKTTETIAYCSYGVLLLVILLGVFFGFRKKKDQAS